VTAEDVIAMIDAAARGPALVFGTPPPAGRDLDLLTAPDDAARICVALRGAGFTGDERHWARFAGGRADLVEVVPTTRWNVADAELAAVAAAGQPLPGCTQLVVPSAADQLLFLARRFARDGRLDDRRRARVATLDAPEAWQAAAARAGAWGVAAALQRLRSAYQSGVASSRPAVRPLAELLAHQGHRWPRVAAAVQLARARQRPRGRLVAFSGLDGSGKSSRVDALRTTLDALGYDVTSTWTRLGSAASLDAAAAPLKRLARRVVRRPVQSPAPSRYAEGHVPDVDPGRSLRESSRALTYLWSLFVTVVHVAGQRRAVRRSLRAGRLVIADRWTLDSMVHLHYRYGDRPFRLHHLLLRRAVPRAAVAFLVDVPAEEALRRKQEQYDLGNLQRQHDLYARLAPVIDARVVDGTRAPYQLDAEIALAVWQAVT
jgi:thymidylate kinase